MRIEYRVGSDISESGGDAGADAAAEKIELLVYGGGGVGLMGRVARATMEAGGYVIGVIPKFLMEKEKGISRCRTCVVTIVQAHKAAPWPELADGFIAMPGGFGTLEEFCEILTWGQLGLHAKPFGMLNLGGFYDHFLAFLDQAVRSQFIKLSIGGLRLTAEEPEELLAKMRNWKPAPGPKWITPERT